jgi:hypothetical protein
MAPDSSALTAGRKLANVKQWKLLGRSAQALWGECQGSALYQVRIDLSTLTTRCSCPSRKLPCKHSLGLLLLAAASPDKIVEGEAPEWVSTWLAQRAASQKARETKAADKDKETKPSDRAGTSLAGARQKNAQKRLAQVTQGIEQLDLWLNDLMRHGLASLETQSSHFWEQQAAQMINAQAPGLATRLRGLAAIPNASPDWTEKLLVQLGKLALLTEAFHHIDKLDLNLQEEVRQLIGWTVKEQDVLATGKQVHDDWLFLGQRTVELDHGRSQRTWLLGVQSQQPALLIQFAMNGAAFAESYPVGKLLSATLAYWPGAASQRALIHTRDEQAYPINDQLPGVETLQAFLDIVATTLASNPWRDRFLCVVRDVVTYYRSDGSLWYIRDREGAILPLVKGEHWQLMAMAGGRPIDLAAEWNGETLLPLGVYTDGEYHLV